MKNGEARSRAWIRRNLPAYTRDNAERTPEDLQMVLELVVHDLVPSLDEIRAWTPEQRLLADDWAINVHLSASDNNNRVPAVPEHLVPYRRRHPQRTPAEAARAVIAEMSGDNDACFHPTPRQWAALEVGIALMQQAGCFFTDAEISLFAAGEHGEVLAHFQRFSGFDVAQKAIGDIFEELNDDGETKTDEERARDARAAHPGSTTKETA